MTIHEILQILDILLYMPKSDSFQSNSNLYLFLEMTFLILILFNAVNILPMMLSLMDPSYHNFKGIKSLMMCDKT